MQSNKISQSVFKNIATIGFVGYLPVAPGTFGTLAAMLCFIYFRPSVSSHALSLIIVAAAGIIASHHAEKILNKKDSRHIVIDEFAGYAVSVIFLPTSTYHYYIAAFFLFRFFDILKPPPIRNIEKILKGGIGIMADDLLAGVFTNLILQAWILLK
jgi:phosphatidylglycerophosphatase A